MKTFLVALFLVASCSPYKPMEPLPGIMTGPPPGLILRPTVTDYDAMVYSHGVKLVLAGRVTNLERGDLAAALTGAALAGGAGIANVSGASAGALAAIAAVGSALSSLTAVVNPAVRANALSEGNILVLQSEGRYLICLTSQGITRVSKSRITPCGAKFVDDINNAIAEVNRLLIGIRPVPNTVPTATPTIDQATKNAINAEH